MHKLKQLHRRGERQSEHDRNMPPAPPPIIDRLDIEKTSAPMILVLGQTGAGKSHFCNKVIGDDIESVKESASLSSCTSKPELISAKVDSSEYFLIDTPGFNDTWQAFKRSDATILGEIAQTLTLQTQLGVKLRGILYLYDISSNRMTGETMRQFELIKRICGERNYENVLLVTTHWPKHMDDQSICAVREGELRRAFWHEMVRGGSTMLRFGDTHSSAKAIVRRLVSKNDITLTLQDELAAGNGLKHTSAFDFIVSARKQDEERMASKAEDFGPEVVDSVEMRKDAEGRLNDDIVEKVRDAIEEEQAKARRKQKRANVLQVFRWILGLTSVAMGSAQVGLAV